jgi:hypothetical protein
MLTGGVEYHHNVSNYNSEAEPEDNADHSFPGGDAGDDAKKKRKKDKKDKKKKKRDGYYSEDIDDEDDDPSAVRSRLVRCAIVLQCASLNLVASLQRERELPFRC